MRGPTLSKNKEFAEGRIMEHVVLALEALHDDAARARVLHSARSHFRIDLPSSSEASAEPSPEMTTGAAAAQPAVEALSFAAAQADEAEVPEDFRLWLNASRI